MQYRFLVDTLQNTHRRLLGESPEQRISYSLFCHLCPFWVVNPTISERDTCMCKLHKNLSFVAVKLSQWVTEEKEMDEKERGRKGNCQGDV